jgi:hypothetical protein
LEELYGEIAFIAYYFHWPYLDILEMEHAERRRWCKKISGINKAINAEGATSTSRSVDLLQLL